MSASEYSTRRDSGNGGNDQRGDPGEERARSRTARAAEGAHSPTLSTAHISPINISSQSFVEWTVGASVLKSSRGLVCDAVGGGQRKDIKGFSRGSRRRLMLTVGSVDQSAPLPCFVTLTWPERFPSPGESKTELDVFAKRMRRTFPDVGFIWKLEPQLRGAPHYHLLAWGASEQALRDYVPQSWYEIAGDGDMWHLAWHRGVLGHGNKPCVEQVRTWKGVMNYAAKYLGKTFDVSGWGDKWTGRYWGVVNRECIPFARIVRMGVSVSKAVEVMRYERRFSRARGRDYPSLTILCDADQWIDRLGISGEIKQD